MSFERNLGTTAVAHATADFLARMFNADLSEYLDGLGFRLVVEHIKPRHSGQQRAGFHWLLNAWLMLDPTVAKDLDQLKTRVLIVKFGAVKVSDQYGNEAFMPVQRTTQHWDWDSASYKRKLLSVELYTDLIDYVYRVAAEDGTELPELSREHQQPLTREVGHAK